MRKSTGKWLVRCTAVSAATAMAAVTPAAHAAQSPQSADTGRWVSAWQGSPVAPGTFDPTACPSDTGLNNQTVRNIVFLSSGGNEVRVRVSNAYGTGPLTVGAASVALSAGDNAGTVAGTTHALSFSGRSSALIAPGGEIFSDPVHLLVRALQTLAVSVYLPTATGPATQHYFATQTNWVGNGNLTGATRPGRYQQPITCWLFATGVDVHAATRIRGTVVTLGDSITDGYGSTTNANRRYPDDLARRLAAHHGPTLAVSNAGIGGNTLFRPRTDAPMFGDPAPARFYRDVLSQAGVRDVILLEGINDIGANSTTAADLIRTDEGIISQAHAAGLRIFGATLTPFGGSHAQYGGEYGTAFGERQRQRLNDWIRTSGDFDGVFDFDKAVRDPAHPDAMLPAYDSGDHLHPGDAGYAAMARTVRIGALLGR